MRISWVVSSRYTLNEILLQKPADLANRKGIILPNDNGRPHVAQLTQQNIKQ